MLAANHLYPEKIQRLFARKIVLDANHQYPEKIQGLFPLPKSLDCKPSLSRKTFKDFFACKIVLALNHHYPETIPRPFRLQSCLRRKSSLSWNYSKTFSHAELSWAQIFFILKTFKDFFACKIVLAANHHYPETIQRLLRQQNCLRRKSSKSWKYSRTFSPAKMSWAQIIIILKTFKDFFHCQNVLSANHHYPENIQRLFRLQKCLSRKSSLSWN